MKKIQVPIFTILREVVLAFIFTIAAIHKHKTDKYFNSKKRDNTAIHTIIRKNSHQFRNTYVYKKCLWLRILKNIKAHYAPLAGNTTQQKRNKYSLNTNLT